MNQRFTQITGRDRVDLVQKDDHEIMDAAIANALGARDLQAVKFGKTVAIGEPEALGGQRQFVDSFNRKPNGLRELRQHAQVWPTPGHARRWRCGKTSCGDI